MDIPDFEELEWLESHTSNEQLFDDDDFDIDIEIEPPDEHESPIKRPTLSLPSNHSSVLNPNSQINNPTAKKRLRSDLPHSTSFDVDNNSANDGKRIRTEDDEFSDADQILLNQNVGSLKKIGGSDDDDDEECQRCSPPRSTEEMMDVVEVETEERIISRYLTEIDGDCVPVTGLDGERVYAKICSANMDADNRRNKLCVRGEFNGLLREPVRDLMQKFEHEEFIKALQASVEGPIELVPPEAPVTNEQLWVDKYAPSSFTELLSDEQTNREVLLWLKQWDPCVFGSEIKSTTEDVLSALRRHSLGSQHLKQSTKSYTGNNQGTRSNYFGNNREFRFSRDNLRAHNEFDKENNISQGTSEIWDKRQKGFGTPEQKILLLCGPPGLGKTTLAHVAARHCGYRVVEINASDDRSASVIEAKILDVVQMNSVISDSKPKCLVIDEIDGALSDGKGAVEIILKLLSAEKKSDTGKGNATQGTHSDRKSSQKKQKNSLLLRPVICICNDLYAPALRPLRQVAKVHVFVQPTVSRVVNRLKYICSKEGVKTSSIALTTLAEYTECDIRSCLNTLQFLNKKKEILNVLEISSQVVGRKDVSRSAFDVWKEIFQKRKGKRDRESNNSGGSMSKDFEFLYSLISNRGDYDVLFDGIHENILQLHYVDPMMQKTVQCLDNLVVSDMTHRYIMRTQQMSLQVYQPPIAIRMHSLIAQLEKKNIEWPKSFHRHRIVLTERLDMFRAWHNKISPYISRHLSTKSFVEDSISPMLHILSPPTLRPVALHLLSDGEKSSLEQLVNIMVSYAITYKNIKFERSGISRHEDALDASTLSFDPPISEFIQLKDYNSCHYDLALAVKKVLVHEVEKQKILLGSLSKYTDLHMKENHALEKNTCNGKSFKSTNVNGPANKKMNGKSPTIAERSGLPISSSSSAAEQSGGCATQVKSLQKIKRPSGGVTNFFDRFRKTSNEGCRNSNNVVQRGGTVQRDLHPLLFKFNEGFTNAVKRPVRVREFLL